MSVRALYTNVQSRVVAYERHLSALAMVVGFVVDSLTFGRIDRPAANIVFCAYLIVAGFAILLAHNLQERVDRRNAKIAQLAAERGSMRAVLGSAGARPPVASEESIPAKTRLDRLLEYLPLVTQFALGGLWSGFLVFYGRSAALAASWPFVLLLVMFLVGNEVFRRYRSRLVFTTLLYFFALYSYAIFVVPVFTGTIGKFTFIGSGVLAVLAFYFFLELLSAVGRARYRQSRWKIAAGAFVILVAMNGFYLARIIPPLPLALSQSGIYYGIEHTGNVYVAQTVPQTWTEKLGIDEPVMQVVPGEPLYYFAAVFAPIRLSTRITHKWQWYDDARKDWVTQSSVTFAISGGREGGYRGYTIKSNPRPGEWRVNVETIDHRLIARLRFRVARVQQRVATVKQILQ